MATWLEKLKKLAQKEKERYEQEQKKQKEAAAAGTQKLKDIAKKAKQEAEEEERKRKKIEEAAYKKVKEGQKQFVSNVRSSVRKTVQNKSTESIDRDHGYNTEYQPKTQAQKNRETVNKLNEITNSANAQKSASNTNLFMKYRKEATDKGLKGEKAYQYAVDQYNQDKNVQSLSKHTNMSKIGEINRNAKLQKDYSSDKQYKEKIAIGKKDDIFATGKLTTEENIAYAEGWSDSYMTNYREFLDKEALKKLWYLKGDQEITGVDHSQEIKDLADAIIADAQQRYEYNRYLTGDYAKNNYYLETPFQGAASTVQGWTNTLQRLFGNISAPVVTAEQIAYQEKLNDAKGFKRIFGLTGYSAAQMITSGGSGGFFFSVAGNTYGQARREGYSDSEALTYAVVNAGLEVGMRRAFGTVFGGVNKFVGKESLLKTLVSKVVKNPVAQKSVSIAGDMLGEGIEEYSQDVADPMVRNMILGEENEFDITPEGGWESFLVGMLVAGSVNSVGYVAGINTDIKLNNAGLTLNDGTIISKNILDRAFLGQATEEDAKLIAKFGSEITIEKYESMINKIENQANVSYGEKTFSQVRQETSRMTAEEKIDYYANLLSSPAYQMSATSYLDEAKQIGQKTDYEKGMQAVREKTASALGKRYGVNVEFESKENPDIYGYFDNANNRVVLNSNSNKSILVTMIHELTHSTENSGFYNEMRKASEQYFNENNIDIETLKTDVRKDYEKEGIQLTEAGLSQEITAKFMADVVFGKETDVINFVYNNRSLGQKIKDWIVDTLGITRKEGENDVLITAERNFEKALSDTSADIDSIDNVQYDIGKSFSEQVDEVFKGTLNPRNAVYVSETPNLFLEAGLKRLPILITQRHIRDINHSEESGHREYHDLDIKTIKELPYLIKNPVIIMDSLSRKDSIVIITEKFDKKNQPIIISVRPNGKGNYNNVEIDTNFITSMYGREGFKKFIENAENNKVFIYINKEKSHKLYARIGVEFPQPLYNYDFNNIIRKSNNIVNNSISQNDENDTEQYDIGESFKEIKPEANKAIGDDKTSTQSIANDEDMGYKEEEENVFTKGTNIPEIILKTKPLYSPVVVKWLEKGGRISIKNGNWEYTDSRGISVTYKNNYPDFKGSGHVVQEVDIGEFKNRSADFRLADRLAPNGPISPNNSWHHHEDKKTLQEIDKEVHRIFTHKGGMSKMKKNRRG